MLQTNKQFIGLIFHSKTLKIRKVQAAQLYIEFFSRFSILLIHELQKWYLSGFINFLKMFECLKLDIYNLEYDSEGIELVPKTFKMCC